MDAHPSRPSPPKRACFPIRWWFLPYLIMITIFVIIIVILVAVGCPLPLAVGVPATLSAVAVRVLARMTQVTQSALPSA
jgi:hypothetical protein